MSTSPDVMFQTLADTSLRLAAVDRPAGKQTKTEKTLKIQMQGV